MWKKDESKERNPVVAGFRIGRELGRGPLGTVYEAVRIADDARVVFRGFTRPSRASAKQWDDAMAQFVELLDRHRNLPPHRSIQQIVDFGEEDGLFWIASEYFEATPLRKILDERGPLPFPWAIQVLGQVAEAVDWAAERGLPHTDLTPFNILVLVDPENPSFLDVKVINFGLGHARRKRGSHYAAPEQQRGDEGDVRSDAWALGALLVEIVSGKQLFPGRPNEVVRRVLGGKPGIPPQLPGTALPVLEALLATEPDRRYHRLTDAVQDLDFGREPAFARLGKRAKSVGGRRPSLSIQKYSLGHMDVVDLRWKKLQKDLAEDARNERRASSLNASIRFAILLAIVGGAFWRASSLRSTFSTATVVALSGSPKFDGRSLRLGEVVRAERRAEVATGPGESLLLTFRGGRLLVPENSRILIGALQWSEAPERRFKVLRGRLVAEPLNLPPKSVFEVSVGSKRVFTRTGRLVAQSDGFVAVGSGEAQVVTDETTSDLPSSPLPDWGVRGLSALKKIPMPRGVSRLWLNTEESLLLPMWEGANQIVSLPTMFTNGKKTLTAQASLQALAPIVQTATLGEGAPLSLDRKTLAPLAVPEPTRKKLLRSFVGNQIDSYRRFGSGGWQIEARAADAFQTPLRLRGGKAGVVPREERFTW